jgi:biopolymer transport protein ExbB
MEPTAAMTATDALSGLVEFVALGGAVMWVIAALSVLTVALILWKVMRLVSFGVWSGGRRTAQALEMWADGRSAQALAHLEGRRSLRAQLARAAMAAALDPALDREGAEAETARVARGLLAQARAGLRGLELASTIAPLLGLLGTVTGMIAAFQALQEAGSRADPALLAGGIWEALLTTAAGMAVAIPAQVALTWFDGVIDRQRHEMEDAATRILHRAPPGAARLRQAAE